MQGVRVWSDFGGIDGTRFRVDGQSHADGGVVVEITVAHTVHLHRSIANGQCVAIFD